LLSPGDRRPFLPVQNEKKRKKKKMEDFNQWNLTLLQTICASFLDSVDSKSMKPTFMKINNSGVNYET